jgi:hypothetical protein
MKRVNTISSKSSNLDVTIRITINSNKDFTREEMDMIINDLTSGCMKTAAESRWCNPWLSKMEIK